MCIALKQRSSFVLVLALGAICCGYGFHTLSAFVLSFVALLVFIWSQSHGLFDRRASGAEIIFASGEIGQVQEPAASLQQQGQLQSAMNAVKAPPASQADAQALRDRAQADASTAPPGAVSLFAAPSSGCWLPLRLA